MRGKLLTPRAVAEIHRCALSSVQAAMSRGEIKARPIYGPGEKLTGWAILESDAMKWSPDPERQERHR